MDNHTPSNKLILILGGARSGKSSFAEIMARSLSPCVLYVATATAGDEEMAARIVAHQASRPASWRTLEEPLALPEAIALSVGSAAVVLIDCLTLWISNLLLSQGDETAVALADAQALEATVLGEVRRLVDVCREGKATFLIIANEVGMGLVPPYPLGRVYRDALGRANQFLAATADEVYLLVAGIPLPIKKVEGPCP